MLGLTCSSDRCLIDTITVVVPTVLSGLLDSISGKQRTDHVVKTVSTGHAPRSMTIAPDGRSLYVVNYESNDVSKVRTSDMKVLQAIDTPVHPIGISFDTRTGQVWVACYRGQVVVFADR